MYQYSLPAGQQVFDAALLAQTEELDCGVEDSDNEHEPEPILFSILSCLSYKASSRSDMWPMVELMWVSCLAREDWSICKTSTILV